MLLFVLSGTLCTEWRAGRWRSVDKHKRKQYGSFHSRNFVHRPIRQDLHSDRDEYNQMLVKRRQSKTRASKLSYKVQIVNRRPGLTGN